MARKIQINKIYLMSFFVAMALEFPSYLNRIPIISELFIVIKLLGYILVLLRLLSYYPHSKLSANSYICVLFCLCLMISTLYNHGSLYGVISYCAPIVLGVFYIDSFNDKKIIQVLKGMSNYLSVITYINFATVLLFTNGLYSGINARYENYYFLGHNNSAVRILVPAIILSALHDYMSKNKISIRTWVLSLVSFVTVTITWSNTSMIGIGIILVFMVVFVSNDKFKKLKSFLLKLNGIALFFVPIALAILLVIFNNVSIFQYIITDIFRKSLDLTGRRTIWNIALVAISKKPILGYGSGLYLSDIAPFTSVVESCHNYFLDLLFRGGVVLLIVQIILNWISCRSLKNQTGVIAAMLNAALLSYFVMWQAGAFLDIGIAFMYMVFILCCKINTLENSRLDNRSLATNEKK